MGGGVGGGVEGIGLTNHCVLRLWSKVQYGNIMHQSFVSTAPSTYKDRWRYDFQSLALCLWGQADANNPAPSPTLHNKKVNP